MHSRLHNTIESALPWVVLVLTLTFAAICTASLFV